MIRLLNQLADLADEGCWIVDADETCPIAQAELRADTARVLPISDRVTIIVRKYERKTVIGYLTACSNLRTNVRTSSSESKPITIFPPPLLFFLILIS